MKCKHCKLLQQDITNRQLADVQDNNDRAIFHQNGSACLHVASQHGHFKVVEILIRSGAYINAINKVSFYISTSMNDYFDHILLQIGYTPLHLAVQNGHVKVVKTLIKLGANVNAPNMVSWTPYYISFYSICAMTVAITCEYTRHAA